MCSSARMLALGLALIFVVVTPVYGNPPSQTEALHIADAASTTDRSKKRRVYVWTDEEGRKIYSDRPRKEVERRRRLLRQKVNCYRGFSETLRGQRLRVKGVVLLTARWCSESRRLRAWLRKRKIKFTEYDIDRSKRGRQLYLQLEDQGVPVLLVGNASMHGFIERTAIRLLARRER